jgi:hypothetical protein
LDEIHFTDHLIGKETKEKGAMKSASHRAFDNKVIHGDLALLRVLPGVRSRKRACSKLVEIGKNKEKEPELSSK